MKRMLFTLAISVAALSIGCHGQVPSNPNHYACSDPSTGPYVALNTTPVTVLTYADKPPAGTYCYAAQSVNGTQTSLPSSPSPATTLTLSQTTITLTWNAPTTGVAPTGYVIYRAPATVTTILAPTLTNPTVSEVHPALPMPENADPAYQISFNAPLSLRTKVH